MASDCQRPRSWMASLSMPAHSGSPRSQAPGAEKEGVDAGDVSDGGSSMAQGVGDERRLGLTWGVWFSVVSAQRSFRGRVVLPEVAS